MHARTIYGVPACIAVCKRRGRSKRGGIKPLRGGVRARAKHGLSCNLRPDRILAQHSSGVRGVSEYGDGERHSRLNLVDGREIPVLGYEANPFPPPESGNIVNAAQGETVADVTARAFFGVQIPIVLWDGRFVHRRTEVRRIGQILSQGVVGQKAEPVRITAPHIHVARVVPTLRRVLQQIDGADRESFTLHDGGGAARRQHRARHKSERLEGAPRAKRARSGKSVVDQVRSLQVETA